MSAVAYRCIGQQSQNPERLSSPSPEWPLELLDDDDGSRCFCTSLQPMLCAGAATLVLVAVDSSASPQWRGAIGTSCDDGLELKRERDERG